MFSGDVLQPIFFILVVILVFLYVSSIRLLWGLCLLILSSALSPELEIMGLPLRIQDFLIPVLFWIWAFRHITQKRTLKPTKMLLPIGSFLFFMAVATLNAFIVQPDIELFRPTLHFLKHVEYLIIFFLVFDLVEDETDLRYLAYAALGAITVSALQAIVFPVGWENPEGSIPRLRGIVTEGANIYGGFLMFGILLAVAFFLEESNQLKKIAFLIIAILTTIPMLLTGSRSSYVGLFVGLVFLGVMREPKLLPGLFILPIVLTPFLPETVIERARSIYFAFTQVQLVPAWEARLDAWMRYLPEIIRYPMIGQGLYHIEMGAVDNEFVLRAVETGLLGLGTFIWMFGSFIRRAYHGWKNARNAIHRQVHLGYLAGIVGLLVHSLAATSFTAIRTAEPLFFASGLMLASYLMIFEVERGDSVHQLTVKESQRRRKSKRKKFRAQKIPLDPAEREKLEDSNGE